MASTITNNTNATAAPLGGRTTQFDLLDFLFPGFSVVSKIVYTFLGVDLNIYIPLLVVLSGLTVAWQYISGYAWGMLENYLMSVVTIRMDDEVYNMVMAWIASQRFAQSSRRFIANTDISSRCWWLFNWRDDEDDDEGDGRTPRVKPLKYTPSYGSHFFWYKGHLLLFDRHENHEQNRSMMMSSRGREELTLSCLGRNPWILKDLLAHTRSEYAKKDETKTLIYRATCQNGDTDWQRSMSRASRPLSTVILNEKVKKDLIDDVTDYLNPATRRWYSNRGIPYRRGYLLYGPPGTGKSSLSLALSGYFRMKIYMISLSSSMASEENLSSLFSELPRRCVVLLEDIDSAGLTHTRAAPEVVAEEEKTEREDEKPSVQPSGDGGMAPPPPASSGSGRLSLSGLLNILDGVASQEGRVLIMTTNHIEKLDKALIRPGRVDMVVNFGLADTSMAASIYRAIYAPYEGEDVMGPSSSRPLPVTPDMSQEQKKRVEDKERAETIERIGMLAEQFAAKMPEEEFSPAEIQGLLLKYKRDPGGVIEAADEWVAQQRKEKKNKEVEDAEKAIKAEEEEKKKKKKAEEEEAGKKAKEEAKAKDEAKAKEEAKEMKQSRRAKRRQRRKAAKAQHNSQDEAVVPSLSVQSEPSNEGGEQEDTQDDAQTADSVSVDMPGHKSSRSTDSGYETPIHLTEGVSLENEAA